MKALSLLVLAFLFSNVYAGPIKLIPQPVSVTQKAGKFDFSGGVRVRVSDPSLQSAADWFTGQLGAMGQGKRPVVLELMKDRNMLGKEGYALTVTPSEVRIKANEAAGVFLWTADLAAADVAGRRCRREVGSLCGDHGLSKIWLERVDAGCEPSFLYEAGGGKVHR